MPLVIPDDVLKATGLTERDALIEFSCRLYDAGKLGLWPAARTCDLDRMAFINELQKRDIAVFKPTVEDIENDLKTLEALELRP